MARLWTAEWVEDLVRILVNLILNWTLSRWIGVLQARCQHVEGGVLLLYILCVCARKLMMHAYIGDAAIAKVCTYINTGSTPAAPTLSSYHMFCVAW
jgi:hypothetical protein